MHQSVPSPRGHPGSRRCSRWQGRRAQKRNLPRM